MLAAYDEQIRRQPTPDGFIERGERVVRAISPSGGWHGVTFSDLDDANADSVIAAQVARFAGYDQPWEWKYHSYDRPADLPDRLRGAGFDQGPDEALLVAEIADLDLDVPPPDGVQLREVVDREGLDALVSVHNEAFGGDHTDLGEAVWAAMRRQPSPVVAVVAIADDRPVSGGRVEFSAGTDFASIWGGGTVPAWRGRGVFRSLVAYRGRLAAARGFRYLQVDASPDSRPILKRLGFVELATTIPFTYPGP